MKKKSKFQAKEYRLYLFHKIKNSLVLFFSGFYLDCNLRAKIEQVILKALLASCNLIFKLIDKNLTYSTVMLICLVF